ncbi:mitochondrial thiamine pyrophosphate transporter [Maudiozyma exigua]|uniref:Mitochondrial thiamine pyrophosphate transporter n=1 Tax=Maudiozyma exigua TaxID=34358 RepID=A0A9P7B988_MAUEX|nr:mitochondrial thiamine pyrophosphate transporter [Kazachstania exigua]
MAQGTGGVQRDYLRKGTSSELWKSTIAGAIAGVMARNVIAPLDTIKIRLQITPIITNNGVTLYQQLVKMVRHEGIRSFWKGNVSGSMMYVIYNSSQFCTYSFFNKTLDPYTGDSIKLHSSIVGGLSGISSSVTSYPFDILRTRSIANNQIKLYRIRYGISDIWNTSGIRGFYQGSMSAIASISISTSIIFGTYEGIRSYCEIKLNKLHDDNSTQIRMYQLLNHSASSISGLVSKLLTFPIDTVRRRILLKDSTHLKEMLQVSSTTTTNNTDIYKYLTTYKKQIGGGQGNQQPVFVSVVRQMIKHEGLTSFYKGLTMGLVKSVPSTVVTLWTYETIMRVIQ